MLLRVKNVNKTYRSKNGATHRALANINITFDDKGLVFILGKSGSGKSTLLNVIGGLDRFDSGDVFVSGKSFSRMSDKELDSYRNTVLGFIFQDFNLLENLTVKQNIELSLSLQNTKDKGQILNALKVVGLEDKLNSKVTHLSGGQRQRISIARALVKDPRILIADEPTGALDSKTAVEILNKLKEIAKEKLVIVVSHDRQAASEYADRIIEIKDAHIVKDITRLLPGQKIELEDEGKAIFTADSIIKLNKGEKLNDKDLERLNTIIEKSGKKAYVNFETYNNKMKALFPPLKEAIDEGTTKSNDKIEEEKDEAINEGMFVPTRIKKSEPTIIDFKRGRFPTLTALKLGLGNLKLKKFTLFLTLLTSTVSLLMFTLMFSLGQVNINRSVAATMVDSSENTITLTSNRGTFAGIRDDVFNDFLTNNERNNMLVSNRLSMTFAGVHNWVGSSPAYDLYSPSTLNQVTEIENFGSFDSIIHGNAPQEPDEILVSDFVIRTLLARRELFTRDGVRIQRDQPLSVVGETFTFYIENHEIDLTISGLFQARYNLLKPQGWEWSWQPTLWPSVLHNDLMVYATTDFLGHIQDELPYIRRNVVLLSDEIMGDTTSLFLNASQGKVYDSLEFNLPESDNFIVWVTTDEEVSSDLTRIDNVSMLSIQGDMEVDIAFRSDEIDVYTILVTQQQRNDFIVDMGMSNVSSGDFFITSQEIMDEIFELITPISRVVLPMGNLARVTSIIDNAPYFSVEVLSRVFYDYQTIMVVINLLRNVLMWVAVILLVLSVVLLATFISNSIKLTKKQIGIFRAIGSKKLDTFKIFALESLAVGLISAVIALIAFMMVIPIIHTYMGRYLADGAIVNVIVPSIFDFALVIGIAVFISVSSSGLSLRKFNKISPVEAISGKDE